MRKKNKILDKEYKITFTTDYAEYEDWLKEKGGKDEFLKHELKCHPRELALCKKFRGKFIKLKDIPVLVKECGEIILKEDSIKIYNDYRE